MHPFCFVSCFVYDRRFNPFVLVVLMIPLRLCRVFRVFARFVCLRDFVFFSSRLLFWVVSFLQVAEGSTSALLGDYSEAMPTPMSMRTPATPVGEDVVMQAS